ncbi:cytochrome d ubiquinol oxidase subunit II [Mucilaginibacter sp. PPCGB 2223]|uniref:cytochrome d ubiquinol oxidase subunit II n=1 Tax=Mucilaginibacter sp. PPCGB 2223 TaxID=1886027 RepID=UPI0008257D95|nr:cytochrome d ubiquinol oxidase subunit II [Mucilaginibacter sp. PPCGB 2223]OCX52363.1 cytochrome d ubiquinol oxidase subunit II [Mucilaginibacter sp. PPCGB 2223]
MATFLGIDYPTWWFLLIGAVFTGYIILDGFDLGAGIVHLFFVKEQSRRIALNAIGPVWDGNEVWIVIGGGALFAGFPEVYASLLSAFYVPFMLFLMGIVFRAISIEFRSKEPMQWWRRMWDFSYCASSTLIAFLLGVILGNVTQGINMGPDHVFRGSFIDFINPYSILTGITTVALLMMHGAIYLVMKTENRLYVKLTIIVKNATIFFVMMILLTSFYTLLYLPNMAIVIRRFPELFIIPVMMVLAVANITRQITKRKYLYAFISSAVTISLLMVLVAIELYPNMLISTQSAANNLTVYNACSSQKTLGIMLVVAGIGVPLVVAYTTFVFITFKGKVSLDEMSY